MIDRAATLWTAVLTVLDLNRPVLYGDAIADCPPETLPALRAAGLLQELPPALSLFCSECPEGPARDIIFTEGTDHCGPRALFPCPHCGLYEVPVDRLRRWQVERSVLLDLLCALLQLVPLRNEAVPHRLWRLGRHFVGRIQWSVWYGQHLHRRDATDILSRAQLPQRTLLLVPDRRPACVLQPGVVCGALRDLTRWSDHQLCWDTDALAELLDSSDGANRRIHPRRPLPRPTRAADIAALVRELKQHLRAARDYAGHTCSTEGAPRLLPRPNQKQLARQLDISESRVSRSLHDPHATELRLLWELADDLDGLMRYVS